MKIFNRILIVFLLLFAVAFNALSQQVFQKASLGIGTVNPAQKLEISGGSNTARIDGLIGTFKAAPAAGAQFVYVNNPSGDVYSMPTVNNSVLYNNAGVPTWTSPSSAFNAWLYTGNTSGAAYGTYVLGTLQQGATNLPLEFLMNSGSGYVASSLLDNVNGNVYFGGDVNGGWNGGNGLTVLDAASHNVGIGMGTLSVANSSGSGSIGGAGDAGVTNDVYFGYGTGLYMLTANSVAIGTASQRNISGPGATVGGPNTTMGNFVLRSSAGSTGFTTTGSHNTAFGNEAQYGATTASYNTAIGDDALSDNTSNGGTTYSYNTGAGYYSVGGITTGNDNTALGYFSLRTVSTGNYNTAAGYYSLEANTTGIRNVGIGYYANEANSTGSYNAAIGVNALAANTSPYQTAIGANALKSYNSASGEVVAIGDSSMFGSSGAYNEVSIGALSNMAASSGNGQFSAVGYGSGKSHSAVTVQDMAFGYMSYAKSAGTGFGNAAIGAEAMGNAAVTSSPNDAIGVCALFNITSGSYNLAVGNANSITNANDNAPLGTLTTGTYNLAVGTGAASFTNGGNNVSIGNYSNVGGSSTTAGTGSFNSALGVSSTAGSATTAAVSSSENTALGYSASAGNIATLTDYSTAVGTNAVAAPTTGTTAVNGATTLGASTSATANNSTAIGANATANTANTIILGNAANVGTGTQSNVGIGTSTPAQELEVGGTTNTVQINGLQTGGTYNSASTNSNSNILYTNSATGDIYALPNGTSGQVLTLNSGVPTWVAPQVYTATSPLNITGTSLSISGTNGGVMYGMGSNVAFTAPGIYVPGTTYTILTEDPISGEPKFDTLVPSGLSSHDNWGSQVAITDSALETPTEATISGDGLSTLALRLAQDGATTGKVLAWNGSTWKPYTGDASLITSNIVPAVGSAITVANGTNQVVGASNVTLDIQGTSGGILYGTGAGSSAVFSSAGTAGQIFTFGSGVPSWQNSTAPQPWKLTGNLGTMAGTNFVGTTDDHQFVFMSSQSYFYGNNGNPEAGSIDPQLVGATTYGNVYMGVANADNTNGPAGNNDQGTYNVAFGRGTLGNLSTGTANVALGNQNNTKNTTGSYNVTIGNGTVFYNTTANGITIIGSVLSYSNSPGNNTTAIGFAPLNGSNNGINNTTFGYLTIAAGGGGASNIAIGTNALTSTSGSRNAAVGDSALATNTTGANNTALGYKANVSSAALTNATAIGYLASAPVSNSITLGNSSASSLYVPGYNAVGDLLYTSAATGLVSGLTPGTSGYLLQSNGPGNVPTWANITPGSGTVTNITGDSAIVVTGSWTIGIQGIAPANGDKGGVLYSTGTAPNHSASFTPTGVSGEFLTSTGTGAPTWAVPSNAVWTLTGNAGTTPGTEHIGTNDDEPFQFYSGSPYAGNAGSVDPQFVGGNPKGNTYLGTPNGNNIAGSGAGYNDQGSYNVAFGFGCMGYAAATASYNVAMGVSALEVQSAQARMSGTYNVAMGTSSQIKNATGIGNTALGSGSLESGVYSSTLSNYNTAIGRFALNANNANATAFHQFNTAFGYYALETATAGVANSNTGVGNMAAIQSTGSRNTAIGDSALYANTTGANNTVIGYNATVSSAALSNATAIGYNATAPVSNSITLGNTSVNSLYIPGYNTAGNLFYTSAASGLVSGLVPGSSGYLLQSNGPGNVPTWANITPGGGTVTSVTGDSAIVVTGNWNVAIQGIAPANADKGGVLYSTGTGYSASFTLTGTSGQYLTSNGAGAPTWATFPSTTWNLAGGNNISATYGANFIGTINDVPLQFYGASQATGNAGRIDPVNQNIYFGGEVNGDWTGGGGQFGLVAGSKNNVAMGNSPMGGAVSGTSNDVFIGYAAGLPFGSVSNNNGVTVVGDNALRWYTSGAVPNEAFGNSSLDGNTGAGGVNNIGFGYESLLGLTSGNRNVAVGNLALATTSSSSNNTAAGYYALEGNSSGGNNTALGYYASQQTSSGTYNTSIGYDALTANTTSSYNVGLGYNALAGTTTGGSNTGIGNYAAKLGTGGRNVAVGDSALQNNTTGEYNTAIGDFANVTAGVSNATVMGYQATTSVSNSITLGNASTVLGGTSAASLTSGIYLPGYSATGSLFYTSAANGQVSGTGAGTSGYYLQSNGVNAAPTWANIASGAGTVTSVTGNAPIYVSPLTGGVWTVSVQGNSGSTDKGGVLYSAGGGNPAAFMPTGTSGQILTSNGTGIPTWSAYTTPAAATWQITGNAGTTPGTDFVGTIDANRLNFRTDGITAGTIDLPGGNGNTYYGYETGYLNNGTAASGASYGDVGVNNTAIGWLAYHDPDYTGPGTATGNIAIGYSDINGGGTYAQTGSYNIACGFNNMYDLSTGNGNIGIGNKSAHGIGTGNYNTGFGYFTFGNTPNSSSIGSYNVAIGYYSQIVNVATYINQYNSNTSVGYYALNSVGYGRNTAVGSYALNSDVTGTNNTAVGDSAFSSIAFTNTVPYNTALGFKATATAATLTNVTSVGALADAGQNNAMVLGSISGLNNAFLTAVNINVGIATNAPATDASLALGNSMHLETQVGSTAPTTTVNSLILSNGGSGGFTAGQGSTDVAGGVTFTTPTSSNFGPAQITVNFATAYAHAPTVVLAPANSSAAGAITATNYGVYVTTTTTGFTVNFSGTLAGSANRTYAFNYFVIETQ